jgi:hypothetical protein
VARQTQDGIRRRTSSIELWDVNPVGTREAWRRELLQFWSLVATRGRRVKPRVAMGKVDPVTGKGRYLFVDEVSGILANRIASAEGGFVAHDIQDELKRWFADTVVVPGERGGRRGRLPAAGLATPNYAGLLFFNRGVTRERFWAAFLWNALASDFAVAASTGRENLLATRIDAFLGLGLELEAEEGPRTAWSGVDLGAVAEADPETYLVFRALASSSSDGLGDATTGLGEDFERGASAGATLPQLLCPGSVILMRRSLSLLLARQRSIGHAALSDLVETALTFHASQYFVRGMRVLNDLTAGRELPADCRACWDRFQGDVRPNPTPADLDRWRAGNYHGNATAEEAAWVEETCEADDYLFVNAGRKEDVAAKDLARLSLERLRRSLATYTVNRITLAIAQGICEILSVQFGEATPPLDAIYSRLDAWAADRNHRGVLAYAWTQRIKELMKDAALPGPIVDDVPRRLSAAQDDSRLLELVVRDLVSEAILSSRAFTRYIELLNSLLGGGALPTNQDPKGLMARGGSRSVPFHLSLNDRALELLISLAALEGSEREGSEEVDGALPAVGVDSTSFQDFLAFLERRYHIVLTRAPSGELVPSGLLSAASAESVAALRNRLSSMGLLEEYSDSSEWNRITWGADR